MAENLTEEEEKLIGDAVLAEVCVSGWSCDIRLQYKKGDRLEAKRETKYLERCYEDQMGNDHFWLIEDKLRDIVADTYRVVGMEAQARIFERKCQTNF